MSHLRFKEVEQAFNREPVNVKIPEGAPSDYYGMYVFNRKTMYQYLPKQTYEALIYAIDNKEPLNREVADSVAAGMKKWAMDNGVSHYTHWFHPLTDGTAEKHDSFIEHDGKGGVIEEFSENFVSSKSPMRQVSPMAEAATRLRPVATRHGTSRRRHSFMTTPCASPPYSLHTLASRSTTRLRCCARSTALTRQARQWLSILTPR